MTSKTRAVVFDMDGLMFNTEDLYDIVGTTLLKPRGHEFTNELKLRMMGLPGEKAFAVMINDCRLTDSIETLQQESAELFAELLPREVRPMPGLMDLLERLEQSNIPKAVATSSHQKFATIALGQFDLIPRFEFVLTAENVERGKPHPDIYLLAAKKLGHEPAELVVLEDSVIGSTAAAAAGAVVIAVPTQHSVGCDFSHVDHIAKSLDDPVVWKTISD